MFCHLPAEGKSHAEGGRARAAARSRAGPPESSESVSSAAAMSAGEIELASKKDNSFPLDKPVQHRSWRVAVSLGAVPDRGASWVIAGAHLRRRCPAWCASLVALAIMSALAGVLRHSRRSPYDALACAGGGRMCWSVKRLLIARVLDSVEHFPGLVPKRNQTL